VNWRELMKEWSTCPPSSLMLVGVPKVCRRIMDIVTGNETKDMEDILTRRHSCKSPDGRSTPN